MLGKPFRDIVNPFNYGKIRISSLPKGVALKHILGMGLIAGIGFTMSIFISDLAFTDAYHKDIVKISVLIASVFSCSRCGLFKYSGKRKLKSLRLMIGSL